MSKNKQNSPIDLLRSGLESGDWKSIAEAYKGLTGVSITPPAQTPSKYDDLIEAIVARYGGVTPVPPVDTVVDEPVKPAKRRGRPKNATKVEDEDDSEVTVTADIIEDNNAKPLRTVPKITGEKLNLQKETQVINIDMPSKDRLKSNAKKAKEKVSREPSELMMDCPKCDTPFPKRMCLHKTGFDTSGGVKHEYKCPHCKQMIEG